MATWQIEITKKGFDPVARDFEGDARDMGLKSIAPVKITQVWFLEGDLSTEEVEKIAQELLGDRVAENWSVTVLEDGVIKKHDGALVLYNPGVMDPSVATVLRALEDMGFKGIRVRSGREYRLGRELGDAEKSLLSRRLLFNPLIQHLASPGERVFARPRVYRFRPVTIPLCGKSDIEIEEISRTRLLALSLAEMRILRQFYEKVGRDPTDVELETFAQTWSEHCQHKTFQGEIIFGRRRIKNLLKSTIMKVTDELAQPWVLSAFKDNSGVIEFDENYGVSFKVETHNHPSALEPYGGAATGIGGVIRDCLGTGLGAKPILNTDVFCFGYPGTNFNDLPKGVLHPRRVMKGVVAGVRDYGNRMGIPTANGAVYFDNGYLGNPLVFCGTVGLIPKRKLRKKVSPGQAIVLLGGRTGRDGIHGVTFASLELDARSGEFSSGAVQIGNPIEEKKLMDLILEAQARTLFSAITDCGGGGLSSAVGEMVRSCGCEVWLDKVPLKYPGLSPVEIWVSESQERMVVFVEPEKVKELLQLAREYDVEATVIGKVTGTKRLILNYRGSLVADLPMKFLHNGWRVRRVARWERADIPEPIVPHRRDLTETVLKLLGTPNIASKEWVIRQYDHEVQSGTVLKPLSGVDDAGPADACVITPLKDSFRACVVSCGLCPRYGLVDPYWMAASAIDEALRNCVAAGGDIEHTAILDNFCWGSPENPEALGGLVRAAEGCYDTARGFRVPFISGKDSLYNEFKTEHGDTLPIPGTLLISAISVIPDYRRTTTPDFKRSGSVVFLLGETFPELGGSEYLHLHGGTGRDVPMVQPQRARRLMKRIFQAIGRGLILSCHDLAEGGLAVALAEMSIGGGFGVEVELRRVPGSHRFERDDFLLFSESNSRFLCEVSPQRRELFERFFAGFSFAPIGRTVRNQLIVISGLGGNSVVNLDLNEASCVWRRSLTRRFVGK
ncbi:MAG: phosphoribosylformylglycinamidine synthase subunit PurL [bacterium]